MSGPSPKFMRSLALVLALTLLLLVFSSSASAASSSRTVLLGTQKIDGKTWFVELAISGKTAVVWLRRDEGTCCRYVRLADITIGTKNNLGNAKKLICGTYRVFEAGKGIVGCGAAAGTAICALGGPAGAVVCRVSVATGLAGGYLDCLEAFTKLIAVKLGTSKDWVAVGSLAFKLARLRSSSLGSALELALEAACSDIGK
ncbi:MAG: hypothetical protein AB1645_08515 [Bacillota bacterium]